MGQVKIGMKQVRSTDFQRTIWGYILDDRNTQNIKFLCLKVKKVGGKAEKV
jgi:hypothetical protein